MSAMKQTLEVSPNCGSLDLSFEKMCIAKAVEDKLSASINDCGIDNDHGFDVVIVGLHNLLMKI